uniref:Aminotransferase-like plant mobile domain-containing protein n=1 Tax=Fagus sylvatica TaxID=28930 RepID=A0A2N9FQU8_FAGSY
MSDRGSGSGGPRRSDRLAKGKAVAYEPESSPDTDDEYDAMEDVHTRVDASIARNLQVELNAEAAGLASSAARPSSRPGIAIGRSARPSGAPRQPAAAPTVVPPARSKRRHSTASHCYYSGGRYTSLDGRPRPSIIFCPSLRVQDPPESVGRGGWSDFCQLLETARQEYRDFLAELGFVPFLSIRYVHVWHPLVSAILGICFGGRIPPSEPIADFEVLEILGIDDPAAIEGKKLPSLRIRYLRDLLRREIEEPPTELRYRQWVAYFIFSCFLGNDKSTFIIFWAFEHFPPFAPSRLPSAPDSVFPLARRWDPAWIRGLTSRTLLECHTTVDCLSDADVVFQPYSSLLVERPEVFRSVELSHLRVWIRSPRSWELLMGERTIRQMGGEAVVPVDPPQLMSIEGYIPRDPSDSYVAGVDAYPDLIRADVPYQEWFEQPSLSVFWEVERLQNEILRLQLELSVSEDLHVADMDRVQGEMARTQMEVTRMQGEMAQMQADLVQRQRDLDSRDAALATHVATIRRLEDQLMGAGIPPLSGAGSSGFGQTSSPPPPDPVSRDWFFDDPPSL